MIFRYTYLLLFGCFACLLLSCTAQPTPSPKTLTVNDLPATNLDLDIPETIWKDLYTYATLDDMVLQNLEQRQDGILLEYADLQKLLSTEQLASFTNPYGAAPHSINAQTMVAEWLLLEVRYAINPETVETKILVWDIKQGKVVDQNFIVGGNSFTPMDSYTIHTKPLSSGQYDYLRTVKGHASEGDMDYEQQDKITFDTKNGQFIITSVEN